MFYALAKDEANYKEKINLFVALAPVVRIDHTKEGYINKFTTKKLIESYPILKKFGIRSLFGPKTSHVVGAPLKLAKTIGDTMNYIIRGD
jgi:hypothetical protein